MFSQVRGLALAADRVSRVHQSAKTKQPPGPQLQAQLEKVASTSLATIGARSSFSGARLAHEFPRSFLVSAIIFPHTKWLKKITDYRDTPALRQDPLDLSFWSFLTFLHHGIEEVERHLLRKFYKNIRRKSWSNVPPKLVACIGFLYKVVHKIGRLRKFNRFRGI